MSQETKTIASPMHVDLPVDGLLCLERGNQSSGSLATNANMEIARVGGDTGNDQPSPWEVPIV